MSVLQRVDLSNEARVGPAALDESWLEAFPALYEYLTAAVWPDGKARQVATLLLLAEDGRWKVMINDRANGRTLWLSGETVEAVLEAADRALGGGCAEWRRSASPPGRGRSR